MSNSYRQVSERIMCHRMYVCNFCRFLSPIDSLHFEAVLLHLTNTVLNNERNSLNRNKMISQLLINTSTNHTRSVTMQSVEQPTYNVHHFSLSTFDSCSTSKITIPSHLCHHSDVMMTSYLIISRDGAIFQ